MVVSALYAPMQVGGAEKVAQQLAEIMVARGHSVTVVTTVPRGATRVRELAGVRVHDIGLRNVYWPYEAEPKRQWLKPLWHVLDRVNPWMQAEVARLMDAEKPDVVHTHNLTGFSTGVWIEARARSLPVVHTLHDYSLLCPRATMYRDGHVCARQCGICRAYTLPALNHSQQVDAAIGVSAHTLKRHIDAGYFAKAAIHRVIHNGLVPLTEPPTLGPRPAKGPLRLGFVGRLAETKGIRELVMAMRAFAPDTCTLDVAGRGSPGDENELRGLAGPNVRFLGFVDPATVYRNIDVLVVPSLWEEPLGMIVLEAYQYGLPIIAANRGGLPEMVEHDRTGLVYDAADPAGLQDAIRAFVAVPGLCERMRPAIGRRAAGLTANRMADEYLGVIEGLVRQKAGAGTVTASP